VKCYFKSASLLLCCELKTTRTAEASCASYVADMRLLVLCELVAADMRLLVTYLLKGVGENKQGRVGILHHDGL
jgi:hypothetical protein